MYYKKLGWLFLGKKFRVPYIVGSLCRDMTVLNIFSKGNLVPWKTFSCIIVDNCRQYYNQNFSTVSWKVQKSFFLYSITILSAFLAPLRNRYVTSSCIYVTLWLLHRYQTATKIGFIISDNACYCALLS